MSSIGHNTIAGDELRSLIERAERQIEENKQGSDLLKDIYTEAKSKGFTPAIMKLVIKERAEDKAKRQEREALLDTYRHALGMLSDTPLGEASLDRIAERAVKAGHTLTVERGGVTITAAKDKDGNLIRP